MNADLIKIVVADEKPVQLIFETDDAEMNSLTVGKIKLLEHKPVDLYFHLKLTEEEEPDTLPFEEPDYRKLRAEELAEGYYQSGVIGIGAMNVARALLACDSPVLYGGRLYPVQDVFRWFLDALGNSSAEPETETTEQPAA